MGERIDVTVVVPCYNTEKYLDQALSSIEQNDRCSLEVLAINDGSTDGSLAIMRAHEAADSRVRVIDKPNQGYGATVNRGFDEARGTYVAIVEPDDWVEPHMYDDLFDYARSFSPALDPATAPGAHAVPGLATAPDPATATGADGAPDIVKTPYWRVLGCNTGEERKLRCVYYGRVRPAAQPFTIADAPRLVRHHPSIWSALYRRDFLRERGIRLLEVPGAGWVDTPFAWEVACAARSIVYLEREYYCYREDLAGSSSNRRIGPLSFTRWQQMADVVEKYDMRDAGVLEALYYVGLRYVTGARREGSLDDAEVAPLVTAMCERMDPAVVAGLTDASPAARAYVLEKGGHAVPRMSKLPYLASLAGEFCWSCRANGVGFALGRIGLALH